MVAVNSKYTFLYIFFFNVINERPSFNKQKIRFLVAYCQQHIKNHSTYLIAIIIKKFE